MAKNLIADVKDDVVYGCSDQEVDHDSNLHIKL